MKHLRLTTVLLAVLALFFMGVAAQAAIIQVNISGGAQLGNTAGGNPNNASMFLDSVDGSPFAVDGVTTSIVTFHSGNATPQTMTFRSVDSVTGADFDWNLTFEGFTSESGNVTGAIPMRAGVDSNLAGEDRNSTDSSDIVGSGNFEFSRFTVSLGDIHSLGTLSGLQLDGIYKVWVKNTDASTDAGDIFLAGGATSVGTTSLGTWAGPSTPGFEGNVTLSQPALSVDVVPSGDNMIVKAMSIQLSEPAAAGVPEPSTFVLAGLGLLGIVLVRRRRR